MQLLAEENRDDSGRRFVRAQTVIVTGACYGQSEQIGILVDSLDYRREERQKLRVLHGRASGIEQVLTVVGGQTPVVVLARTVNAREGLLVQQADKIVLESDLLHQLHGELVLVGSEVCGREYRRVLVLRRSDLVMLGLGGYAEPPQMLVEILHIIGNAFLYRAEIVVVKLLPLGSGSAEQRSARENKVLSLIVSRLVDEEVLLFRADGSDNALCGLVAEQAEYTQSRVGYHVHGSQQRGLFIKRLARIRIERGGNVQRALLYERVGGRVPSRVAARLERRSDTARRKARRVGLALDKLLARKLHNHRAVAHRRDEAVVLLGGDARHRLKPVRIVGRALFDRPVLHCRRHYVGYRAVKLLALRNGLFQRLEHVLRQALLHRLLVEHVDTELVHNIKFLFHCPFPP